MSASGADAGASLATAMRGALARAELLAGQLAREAASPRARTLARALSGALHELDRLATHAAALLGAGLRPSPRPSDLAGLPAALRERLAGALGARGITWEPAEPAREPIPGDAEVARRAALLLVRAATAELPPSARLRLACAAGALGPELRLEITPGAPSAGGEVTPAIELRAFLARIGGSLERRAEAACDTWRVSLGPPPAEEPACPPS